MEPRRKTYAHGQMLLHHFLYIFFMNIIIIIIIIELFFRFGLGYVLVGT